MIAFIYRSREQRLTDEFPKGGSGAKGSRVRRWGPRLGAKGSRVWGWEIKR